jgi:hypothetical protein
MPGKLQLAAPQSGNEGWGLFLLVARTQRSKSAASRGPLYFAWGCFRDFLSSEQIDRTKTHLALGGTVACPLTVKADQIERFRTSAF